MQVYCSNCNTSHSISYEEMSRLKDPVINCTGCEKKIKLQFCPHCGAFYSITFSNIRPGSYRYKCKKCSSEFMITIPELPPARTEEQVPEPEKQHLHPENTPTVTQQPVNDREKKTKNGEQEEKTAFMLNSINTFKVNELFSATATSFSLKKIIPSAVTALLMLLLVRIFTMVQEMIPPALFSGKWAASLLFNLLPATILFSFYTAAAAIVAKVTLEKIFYNNEPDWDSLVLFAVKKAPGILVCNVTTLLLINLMLVLSGKIPLLGPVFFSLAFLPVYLISVCITVIFFTGLWFYPPIVAHRESSMFNNLKDLMMFIKKHNLNMLFMIPAALMLTFVTFAAIFVIHSFALSLTVSISRAVLSGDASAIFSGIPVLFVKISEISLPGINSSLFRELSTDLSAAHYIGGFITGISMTIISVLLVSVFFSITATLSTHIYIMMERGLTVNDKRKALTLFILFMTLAVFILVRKLL